MFKQLGAAKKRLCLMSESIKFDKSCKYYPEYLFMWSCTEVIMMTMEKMTEGGCGKIGQFPQMALMSYDRFLITHSHSTEREKCKSCSLVPWCLAQCKNLDPLDGRVTSFGWLVCNYVSAVQYDRIHTDVAFKALMCDVKILFGEKAFLFFHTKF